MNHHLRPYLCLLLALCSRVAHSAETLSVVPDSAQALSIAGGRLANLNDASVVRVSPTQMLKFERTELLLNSAVWQGTIRLTGANGGASVEMDEPWVHPGSFYLVVPVKPGQLAVGIGVSSPFGMGASYPKDMDPRLRYVLPYEARMVAIDITPAVAFRATDSLTLAAGMDIYYSDLQLRQVYPWGLAVPGSPDGEIELRGNGWGIGAYLSAQWQIATGHRVVFSGRLPVKISYSGDFTATGMPAALKGAGFSDSSQFESDLNYPGSISVGYGVDVTDRLTLGFDFQWSANRSQDALPLSVGNNQGLLPSNQVAFGWKNSIDLGAAASYKLSDAWAVRAGYLFSENSIPEATFTPSVAANDRHVFSLGLGWRGVNWGVDATYAFVYNPSRTIGSAVQPAFNGSYKHEWHVAALSLTRRF